MADRYLGATDEMDTDDNHTVTTLSDGEMDLNDTFYGEGDFDIDNDLIAPDEMLELTELFTKYVEKMGCADMHRITLPFVKNFISSAGLMNDVVPEKFYNSYRKYTRDAVKHMDIKTMIMVNRDFLEDGASVEVFSGYPKAPPTLLVHYCKKMGLTMGFGYRKEAVARMEEDVEGRELCQKEVDAMHEKYIEALKKFLETRKDVLTKLHKKYAKEQLEKALKKNAPSTPKAKKTKKEEFKPLFTIKEQKKTAFDFFLQANHGKYCDMGVLERLRKLEKKFAKLDPKEKKIYERLAD